VKFLQDNGIVAQYTMPAGPEWGVRKKKPNFNGHG